MVLQNVTDETEDLDLIPVQFGGFHLVLQP